jgi:hypothetical protein
MVKKFNSVAITGALTLPSITAAPKTADLMRFDILIIMKIL